MIPSPQENDSGHEPDLTSTPQQLDEGRENGSIREADEAIRQELEKLPNIKARVEFVANLLRTEVDRVMPAHVMRFMEQVGANVPSRPKVSVALADWRQKNGIANTDSLPQMTDEKLAEHAAAVAAASGENAQLSPERGAVVEFRRGSRNGSHLATATPGANGADDDILDAEIEEEIDDSVAAAKAAAAAAEEVAAAAEQAEQFQKAQHAVDAIAIPEVRDLAEQVLRASGIMAFQNARALREALSPEEQEAERALAEWERAQRREARRRAVTAELRAETAEQDAELASGELERTTTARISQANVRDLLAAREALAEQRRHMSPHARLASLAATRKWVFRGLVGIMIAGMVWSADNVQQNMSGGSTNMAESSYWTGYIVEALASLMLVVLMIATHKLSEHGAFSKEDDRSAVVGIAIAEGALLLAMVGLNTYPYLAGANQDWTAVWTHSVAPTIVALAVTVHRLLSGRFAKAFDNAAKEVAEADVELDVSTVFGDRGKA